MTHQKTWRSTRFVKRGLLIALIWVCSLCAAQETGIATAPGALILSPTFECIGVKAPFSNDDNQSNSALIQYRATGSSTWMNAYPPLVDRRAMITGTPNPYANQARVSIVGLTPNTNYEVQVIWTDSDGVSGSNPVRATVRTLSLTPNFGGRTISVTNDAEVTEALKQTGSARPGDTVRMAAGNYKPVVIARSGTPDAWIKVECDPTGRTNISGIGDINVRFAQSVQYVYFQYCRLTPSDTSALVIAGNANHIFVKDITIEAVSTTCATAGAPRYEARYGDAGIRISGTSTDIYILGNTISAGKALESCTGTPVHYSPATGIFYGGTVNNRPMQIVICDNAVTGAFRDSITSDSAPAFGENVDQCRNKVSGYKDDGIESKGSNVNVRLWGNISTVDQTSLAATCLATNTITSANSHNQYGPLYAFRSTCSVATAVSSGATVFKLGGAQTYVFHYTVDTSATGTTSRTRWDGFVDSAGNSGPYNNLVAKNNILIVNGNAIAGWGPGAILDYNLYRTVGATNFARAWSKIGPLANFAAFTSATGQERNGKCSPAGNACNIRPGIDSTLRIDATSPAYQAGTSLPNFNGTGSAWPFRGSAPSIGAYEP
jgi:hypothetical protein